MAKKPARTLDIECYQNFFLLLIRDIRSQRIWRWEIFNGERKGHYTIDQLIDLLEESTIVSFNGLAYDHALTCGFVTEFTNEQLYALSQYMINTPMAAWKYEDEFDTVALKYTHIDIMPVAPLQASLKIYGGRMGFKKLQDLPVPWDEPVSEAERDILIDYCGNDNEVTAELFIYLKEQLLLRQNLQKVYGIKLLSKSDAQIAEGVIKKELFDLGINAKSKQLKPLRSYRYDAPECISFNSPGLNAVFNVAKNVDYMLSDKGSVLIPKELRKVVKYKGKKYQFGIGGLHSKEANVHYPVRDDMKYVDFDVTSYYPSIILTNGYYPKTLGPKFLDVYGGIVDRRIAAKKSGDKVTADSLKIVINASFGKFGNQYSSVYDPKLLLQTTITGQLCLLMLVEMYEEAEFEVISANTDGVMIKLPDGREDEAQSIAREWERRTGMFLEDEWYECVYKESVNSYFGIDTGGVIKGKGTYAKPGLQKNPNLIICSEAVIAYVENGTPVETTINNNRDINKIINLRTVGGGALYKGQEVGKSVRWYYKKGETDIITYVKNGNKVPNSQGARLVNRLPEKYPSDVDNQYYINKSYEMLSDLGVLII